MKERNLPQSLRETTYERKLKSGYLERRIYERPLHLTVSLLAGMKANMAVDKSRNMEHPGTSNNYDNYEKKMCQLKFCYDEKRYLSFRNV